MKSLNAKRIAALAASLAVGLAVAGPVSFNNIPIINNAGQPVVQIVVGSNAKPSDGVVAANMAAVIGNLAYTSTPITATVGNTGAVSCVVTTPTCTLTNQSVVLGERGAVSASGSYPFSTLIGSVINGAVTSVATMNSAKNPDSTGTYSYSENTFNIAGSPSFTSGVPTLIPFTPNDSISATTNGGGVTFSAFDAGNYLNALQIGNSKVPGLMSSYGPNSESEYLWIMGFPVFDQALNGFAYLDAGGAYQVVFGTPVQVYKSGAVNHATISLLGSNWTIANFTLPTSGTVSSSTFAVGGKVQLAQAISGQQTVYVGHNITAGNFTVHLSDLSYPNSTGVSAAAIAVYYNGALAIQNTSVEPKTYLTVNASGHILNIFVNKTFPGLYAYQKWAQIQMYANIVNVTSGKSFSSTNPDWTAVLRWTTNSSSDQFNGLSGSSAANSELNDARLQSIIIYRNVSDEYQLTPGGSFTFITNPAAWKVTFLGDSLGTPSSGNTNYDALQFSTSFASTSSPLTYQNLLGSTTVQPANQLAWNSIAFAPATTPNAIPAANETAITEPANLFNVVSSGPYFTISSYPSTTYSSLQYSLDTYMLKQQGTVNSTSLPSGSYLSVTVTPGSSLAGNYFATTAQTIKVTGYYKGSLKTVPITLTTTTSPFVGNYAQPLDNVTNVELDYAYPNPGVTVTVNDVSGTNALAQATLAKLIYNNGPEVTYSVPGQSYLSLAPANTVSYSGESGTQQPFTLTATTSPSNTMRGLYFTYNIPEVATQGTSNPITTTSLFITNQTGGITTTSNMYWLNESFVGGTSIYNNNLIYTTNTQGTQRTMNVSVGFRTERGSYFASMSKTNVVYDMAKSLDTLNFLVGPSSSAISSAIKDYGPYTVGEATNIPNVTVANVTAKCAFSTTSCSVTGLKNLTATPSATQAITPVTLNTATTPLAVLDTNANQSATLIVVGSKFVNSVAAQIFAQNPSLNSTFGPSSVIVQAFGSNRILVAGYSANQTVQAGDEFIQDLLANAAK